MAITYLNSLSLSLSREPSQDNSNIITVKVTAFITILAADVFST